jgi:hypothetical protein
MVTHLIKKFKCSKHPDVENVSDMDLYNKSILRINELPTELKNIITVSNNTSNSQIDIINSESSIVNMCEKCNKIFASKYYTSRHFLKCKNL